MSVLDGTGRWRILTPPGTLRTTDHSIQSSLHTVKTLSSKIKFTLWKVSKEKGNNTVGRCEFYHQRGCQTQEFTDTNHFGTNG